MKYLINTNCWFTLLVLLLFLEILNEEEKSSEHDFRAFFFSPPTPKSEKKNPVNQLIKNFWPKYQNLRIWSK